MKKESYLIILLNCITFTSARITFFTCLSQYRVIIIYLLQIANCDFLDPRYKLRAYVSRYARERTSRTVRPVARRQWKISQCNGQSVRCAWSRDRDASLTTVARSAWLRGIATSRPRDDSRRSCPSAVDYSISHSYDDNDGDNENDR